MRDTREKGEIFDSGSKRTMNESNEIEIAYGKLFVKSNRSPRLESGAEDISVSVISLMALFTSSTHVAVSKRNKTRMAVNVTIENLVRFLLQKSLSIHEQGLSHRGGLQKESSRNDY